MSMCLLFELTELPKFQHYQHASRIFSYFGKGSSPSSQVDRSVHSDRDVADVLNISSGFCTTGGEQEHLPIWSTLDQTLCAQVCPTVIFIPKIEEEGFSFRISKKSCPWGNDWNSSVPMDLLVAK